MNYYLGEWVYEGRADVFPVQARTAKEALETLDQFMSPPDRLFKEIKSYRYVAVHKNSKLAHDEPGVQ